MRWFLGTILLLVIGIVFQLGLLVYAMYVLLGVMLVSRFLAREWIENITAERECSRLNAQIGDKVAVIVNIHNRGKLPVAWLLVEDAVPRDALVQRPPRISLDGRRINILQLAAGGQKSLLYQVTFLMRGYYQLGPLLVESGDLFGLHRRFRVETKPHFVLVFPKVIPLAGYDLASRRPIGEVRLTHRLFEDPTRISGVREYQPGDALNRIHWRATARMGALHCKMYEPSCIAGSTLLVDFHSAGYPARSEPHRSDLAVTAAASLANAVYQMGQQIGFITNGRDAADRIRQEGIRHEFRTRLAARHGENAGSQRSAAPGRGADPPRRRTAHAHSRSPGAGGTDRRADVSTARRRSHEPSAARDATVVAILPNVPPEAAIALGNLRRRGYAVTALVVMYDDENVLECLGRLIAEGIDVRRIDSEEAIAGVCSREMVR